MYIKQGENLDGIETIIANVENLDSIMEMCFQTKLLLNCVGPVSSTFKFYQHCFQLLNIALRCSSKNIENRKIMYMIKKFFI